MKSYTIILTRDENRTLNKIAKSSDMSPEELIISVIRLSMLKYVRGEPLI